MAFNVEQNPQPRHKRRNRILIALAILVVLFAAAWFADWGWNGFGGWGHRPRIYTRGNPPVNRGSVGYAGGAAAGGAAQHGPGTDNHGGGPAANSQPERSAPVRSGPARNSGGPGAP